MKATVAEIIVDYLYLGGVRRIYGVPGDSINPLLDAIRRDGRIKYVQVRHEEAGAFAASYDSKFNRTPAACFGTSGPGSIHLLNGLYDAKMDHAPVIAITGQVRSDLIGHDYHQEVNLAKLFDDVSVFNRMLIDPESTRYLISRALREAKEKRGVAHLNVPVDLLRENVEVKMIYNVDPAPLSLSPDLAEAVDAINDSESPVILAGAGTLDYGHKILALSEKIGAPIIYALLAKGLLSDSQPEVMGGLGLLGSRASVNAIERSDLIIAIGTTFPYTHFIPEGKKIIQVDIDSSNIGREFQVDIPVHSDAGYFMDRTVENVNERQNKFVQSMEKSKLSWEKYLENEESTSYELINLAYLSRSLSEELGSNAVVVTDTGNVTLWIGRHFRAKEGQRFLFSGGLATMGCSLPGAIGAALSTNRPVISVIGDGGLAMTAMELSTVKKYRIPLKIVVFNNSKLAMIKYEQEVMGYPE